MRDVYTITIKGMSNGKLAKTVEIISKSLVEKAGKSVVVIQEGYYSESFLASVNPITDVYVICAEDAKPEVLQSQDEAQ